MNQIGGYPLKWLNKYKSNSVFTDKYLERWFNRLQRLSLSSQFHYIQYFSLFCERFQYSPEAVFKKRYEEVLSQDPIKWGVLRDEALLLIRELSEGNRSNWPESAKEVCKPGEKSPFTSRLVGSSLTSFLETFGERLELSFKSKDLPGGDHDSILVIRPEEVREILKHAGRLHHRNTAAVLFLKDNGLRVSDLSLFTVGDYRRSRSNPYFNRVNDIFLSFEAVRTRKEGFMAHVIIGPESVEALDNYLLTRRDIHDEAPLFPCNINPEEHVKPGGFSMFISRMIKRGLGNTTERVSAHSIRKLHLTGLEAGGMSPNWVKYLQGKRRDVYSLPDSRDLMSKYMECYDNLRVYPESMVDQRTQDRLEDQDKRIEELTEQVSWITRLWEQRDKTVK